MNPETKLRNEFAEIYPTYSDYPKNLDLKYKMSKVEIDDKYLFPIKHQK